VACAAAAAGGAVVAGGVVAVAGALAEGGKREVMLCGRSHLCDNDVGGS
jgi:hypothetical protein